MDHVVAAANAPEGARETGLHFTHALLPDGWARGVRIAMQGGRIAHVERDAPPRPDDRRGAIGLPGMPNLHSHAFQRGMAGLTGRRGPEGDSFWSWRTLMYRFVARLTPGDIEAIAALAYMEMLEQGFTRVGEFHYLHHDPDGRPYADPAETGARIAAAAEQTGIALTLLPVFYAHGGFGGAAPAPGQARFLTDPAFYALLVEASRAAVAGLGDAVVGIAPHSLRAATPAELAAILPLTDGGPVHIHIAEQVKEVDDCLAWSGARPVQWLLDHAPVDRRWCLVHATHMSGEESRQLAASGAIAGLCPITEADLGDGLFPAIAWREAGGAWGVGSDSNVLIDMAGELRLLEQGQRLHARARNVLAAGTGRSTGRTLFDEALHGGARALGVGDNAGLTAGAAADVVSLDPRHPSLIGREGDEWLDSLIFAGGKGTIGDVWRAGRKVVAEGRHVGRAAIVARYRDTLSRLLAS